MPTRHDLQPLGAHGHENDEPAHTPTPPEHTPGPWTTGESRIGAAEVYDRDGWIVWYNGDNIVDEPTEKDVANARRIVACVNACEGIADPAAALAEVREILTRIARTPKHGEPEDADPQYTQDWTDPNAPTLATMHTMIDMARAALALLGEGVATP